MPEFDATKYKNEFQKDNYDRISLVVPKEDKEKLKAKAKEKGYKSLNEFVVDAVYEKADLPKPEKKKKGRIGKKRTEQGDISAD